MFKATMIGLVILAALVVGMLCTQGLAVVLYPHYITTVLAVCAVSMGLSVICIWLCEKIAES